MSLTRAHSSKRPALVTTTISHFDTEAWGGGGGDGEIPYKRDGDARWKFKLNSEGRLMWVWLKLKLTPKGDFHVAGADYLIGSCMWPVSGHFL